MRESENSFCCSNTYIDHLWDTELYANGYDWGTSKSYRALSLTKMSFLPPSERFNETVTGVEDQFVQSMVPYHRDAGIVTLSGLVMAAGTVRVAAATARGVSGFCGRVSGGVSGAISGYYQ